MLLNQSLFSLILIGWSVVFPFSLIQRQAIASEVTPSSTPTIESSTQETPAIPKTAPSAVPTTPPTPPATPAATPPTTPTATTIPPADNKVLATRLVLNLKERKVYAYQDNKVLASYPVAIGKKGWETPKGNFKVIQLIENPSWKNPWNGKVSPPGPKSPLGVRWIGFWTDGKNFIGFHGTPGEHVMGQAVSHGCVRMRNKDIQALFNLVKMEIPVVVQ